LVLVTLMNQIILIKEYEVSIISVSLYKVLTTYAYIYVLVFIYVFTYFIYIYLMFVPMLYDDH
jgi:hypothetical protein